MRPHSVTLLEMQPHYGQSSCENATPSSGTSPIVVSHDIVVIILPDLGGVHECELTDDYCKRYFLVGLLLREVSTNICARIVF